MKALHSTSPFVVKMGLNHIIRNSLVHEVSMEVLLKTLHVEDEQIQYLGLQLVCES